MKEILRLSAKEIRNLIIRKEVSPVEVLRYVEEAINGLDRYLNSVVSLRLGEAMKEALMLQEGLLHGEETGRLCGVPILVKDLEHVRGMPTTFGSTAFKDNLAPMDSIQVQRLRAAGAIVVGKTNTPEFGFTGFTKNRLFGTTLNPWDLSKTPGGSSGGSAAAVTACLVPIATGSDAGGSIRIPASYCGCVGLKPTFGRIPIGPDFQGFGSGIWTLGPLSRSVEDAALYLSVASGHHPMDPHSIPLTFEEPSYKKRGLPEKLRIIFSPDLGRYPIERGVRDAVEAAVRVFGDIGYEIGLAQEEFPDLAGAWWTFMSAELAFQLRGQIESKKQQLNRTMVKAIEDALEIKIEDLNYQRALRAEFYLKLNRLFDRYHLLLTPTTPTVAFNAEGPPPDTIEGNPIRLLDAVAFTYPFNLSGHPALSIRAGLDPKGLPVGIQLVGPLWREDLIISVAREFEEVSQCHKNWPCPPFKGSPLASDPPPPCQDQ